MILFARHITVISIILWLFHTSLWSEIAGQNRDGAANISQASSTASTTVSSPIKTSPYSFFIRSLLRNCSPDIVQVTGPQWEDRIRLFLQRNPMAADPNYSCSARCGLEQRNASLSFIPLCYCDELCDDFGDCCFNFDELCRKNVKPQNTNRSTTEICFGVKHYELSAYLGYVVWNTCPKNWKERSVLQKCQGEDESDLLRNLPVFDEDSRVTYKNVFCARCNGALNTTYWKIVFDCKEWINVTAFNLTSDLGLLLRRCSIDKRPKNNQLYFMKRCIPRFQDCHNTNQEKNNSYCQAECLRYAFPVCVGGPEIQRFSNPQCALCNGINASVMESICERVSGILPPLTVLFDFTSTSKYNIVIRDNVKFAVQQIQQLFSCAFNEVYDPFAGRCTKIIPVVPQTDPDHKGQNGTEKWNPNCITVIAFNKSDYERLSNGSIYLKPHDKIYNNNTFTMHGKRLFLCANFSRNFTATEKGPGMWREIIKTRASLELLTSIGCIVSMVSLCLLLVTYILFAELRNLPGKIIINLAISLLLYQSVYFSAIKIDDPDACLAVAVVLHFFILASFAWMNVMAYDMHRTFTSAAVNQQGGLRTRFIKYSVYAWGAPAIAVLICVIFDEVKKGSIGYGQGEKECFISQPRALLYSFILPVVLVMIFNLFALGHTTIHIITTRKRSQRVTNHRRGGNVVVICVKMASVMGITWIFGIAANLKALSFLWYPYVVLNSLQGLFIFLCFAASGKALNLYRAKLAGIMRDCRQNEDCEGLSQNCDEQSVVCRPNEDQNTQDTYL